MKSIVIIGKGPSLHRSTKKLVDLFDEVAIVNRPIYEGYEHLISDHADWDFTNDDAPQYSEYWKNKLNIKNNIDTTQGSEFRNKYWKWFRENYFKLNELSDNEIKKYDDSRSVLEIYFGPSNGPMVFEYFVRQEEYNKIGLFGFDLNEKSKKIYYFNKEEINNHNIKHLWDNGTYDNKTSIHLKDSIHDVEMTFKYLIETFKKYKDKEFHLLSDYSGFKNLRLDNLKLY